MIGRIFASAIVATARIRPPVTNYTGRLVPVLYYGYLIVRKTWVLVKLSLESLSIDLLRVRGLCLCPVLWVSTTGTHCASRPLPVCSGKLAAFATPDTGKSFTLPRRWNGTKPLDFRTMRSTLSTNKRCWMNRQLPATSLS